MTKTEKNLLWGLAVVGVFSLIARNANCDNEDPSLGSLPMGFRKIGNIPSSLTKQINEKGILSYKAKSGPVVVTDLFYQHIKNKHIEEVKFKSYKELDKYVKNVMENYNQIWSGSDNSILLVADGVDKSNKHIYQILALQMHETIDDSGRACWNVHTAQSRSRKSNTQKILWKKK